MNQDLLVAVFDLLRGVQQDLYIITLAEGANEAFLIQDGPIDPAGVGPEGTDPKIISGQTEHFEFHQLRHGEGVGVSKNEGIVRGLQSAFINSAGNQQGKEGGIFVAADGLLGFPVDAPMQDPAAFGSLAFRGPAEVDAGTRLNGIRILPNRNRVGSDGGADGFVHACSSDFHGGRIGVIQIPEGVLRIGNGYGNIVACCIEAAYNPAFHLGILRSGPTDMHHTAMARIDDGILGENQLDGGESGLGLAGQVKLTFGNQGEGVFAADVQPLHGDGSAGKALGQGFLAGGSGNHLPAVGLRAGESEIQNNRTVRRTDAGLEILDLRAAGGGEVGGGFTGQLMEAFDSQGNRVTGLGIQVFQGGFTVDQLGRVGIAVAIDAQQGQQGIVHIRQNGDHSGTVSAGDLDGFDSLTYINLVCNDGKTSAGFPCPCCFNGGV